MLETTIEFLHLHISSAMSVIEVILLLVGLCCMWRFLKMKNLKKMATFICLHKCRITEEMLKEEGEQMPGPRSSQATEYELLDINTLISLTNKTTIENAYLRTRQNQATVEGDDLAAC